MACPVLKRILIGVLLSLTAAEMARAANPACPTPQELLQDLFHSQKDFDEGAVRRIFTRDGRRIIEDPHYLNNVVTSVRREFAPWFEGRSKLGYQEMIREQHRLLVAGPDGKAIYHSPSMRKYGQQVEEWVGGAYRHYSDADYRIELKALCRQYRCPPDWVEKLKELRKRNGRVRLAGIPDQYFPEQTVHKNFLTGKIRTIDIHYPPLEAFQPYFKRLDSLLGELKAVPAGAAREKWIEPLADYVQVFTNLLPFNTGNFSLVMSQANYILMRHGLQPVEHGVLDFLALTHDTPDFRKLFEQAVVAAQH